MKLLNINLDLRIPNRYWLKNPNLNKRLMILRGEVLRLKPDFLCFQEVTDAILLGDLKAMFFHPYSFIVRGILRIQGGLVIGFDYTKWSFVYKRFVPFSNQGKIFSKQMADRLLRKGILMTVFDHKETKERVVIINVHFTANYGFGKLTTGGRKKSDEEREVLKMQLDELSKLIFQKKHIGRITLVSGDFNADLTSNTMQNWLKLVEAKLVFSKDKCTVCPFKNPLAHADQKVATQIDNILYFGQLKNVKGSLVFNKKGKFISDHIGLFVKIVQHE